MKNNFSKTIFLFITLFHFTSYAQELYDVKLKNDTVYNHGVPQFICQTKVTGKANIYSLRSMDNKLQAILIFRFEKDTVKFSGTFPYLQVRYACLYPKIDITTLLESYIRNKVIVKGIINLEGLKAYCKERELVLYSMVSNKSQSPIVRDSILAARAKQDSISQVKFIVHNNAAKPARVFIGDKPKGGSGRVQIIPPHGNLNEHARLTEKIFLINEKGDELKSMPVTKSLIRIVINSTGDGFE